MLQNKDEQTYNTSLEELSNDDKVSQQELIIPELVQAKKGKAHQSKGRDSVKAQNIIDIEMNKVATKPKAATKAKVATNKSQLPMRREATGSVAQKDLLQQYFREVGRHPILTREQEHDLAMTFVETQDRSIAYRLITSNLRLVVKIAKEYQSNIASLLDLIQEGNVGLIKGVAKYDPTKGVRLGSYAQWWIRAYMLKYLVNNARLVKVGTTQAQRKLFFSLNKEKNRLKAAGFKPEAGIVAKNLGVQVKDVKEMEKRLSRPDLSMDLPLGDDQKSSVGDLMVSDDKNAEDRLIQRDLSHRFKQHLDKFSKTLKDREQILWNKRLMADERLTLREIGDLFGLTRERARQIEKGMLSRLRDYLQQELPELDELDIGPVMQHASTIETAVF